MVSSCHYASDCCDQALGNLLAGCAGPESYLDRSHQILNEALVGRTQEGQFADGYLLLGMDPFLPGESWGFVCWSWRSLVSSSSKIRCEVYQLIVPTPAGPLRMVWVKKHSTCSTSWKHGLNWALTVSNVLTLLLAFVVSGSHSPGQSC